MRVTGGVSIKLNPEKKSINVYSVRNVVEEVVDPDKEITEEEAKLVKKSIKVGDVLTVEIKPKDFGRIAAQTAASMINDTFLNIFTNLSL